MVDFNVNTQFGWSVQSGQGADQASGPQGSGPASFQDNVVSLGGLKVTFNYTSDANFPALPTPDSNPSEQTPNQWGSTSSTNQKVAQEHAYYDSFSGHLEQLADQHGLSEGQVNQLVFAHMSGEPIPDETFLNDLLSDIEAKVAEEMLETFGEDAFPSVREQAKAVKEKGKSSVSSSRAQLDQLQDYVNSLPDGAKKQKLQKFINEARSNLGNIEQSLSQLDNASSRGELSNLLSKLNEQTDALKEQINQADTLSSDPRVGAALAAVAKGLRSNATAFSDQITQADQNNQLAQGNWSLINSEVGGTFMKTLETTFGAVFDKALTQYAEEHGLSQAETAQLRFAHFNPDADVDPSIKKMLGEVNNLTLSMMSDQWGIPPGFVPNADSMEFNAQVEVAFDDAFKKLLKGTDLKGLAQQLGVSQSEVKGMLEFLHFNKGMTAELIGSDGQLMKLLGLKDESQLQGLLSKLTELEDGATQEIAQQYGLPAGFSPKASSENYNNRLKGRFIHQFDYNLRSQEPPLTEEQIANVRQALADPMNPSITTETKALIQKIHTQTLGQIRSEFALPAGWTPPVTLLGSIGNIRPTMRSAMGAVEQMEESISIMAKFVDQMADNPAKALLLNVMKMISQAISSLKETIAELQLIDTEIAHTLSRAQKEKSLYKIDLQKKKIEEMKKKKAKLGPLMKFMKIFGPIMKVLMLPLMLAMGPVGLIVAAAMMQDIATGGETNFLTDMFQTIMEEIKPKGLAIALSCAICGAMTMMGGGIVGMEVFFSNSGIIKEIALAAGASEMEAEIANAATQMAVEIVVMIIMTVLTGGAAGGLLVAQVTAKIAQVTAKIMQPVANVLAKALNAIARGFEKFGKVGQKIGKILNKIAQKLKNMSKAADDALDSVTDSMKMAEKASKQLNKQKDALKKALDQAKDAGDTSTANKLTKQLDHVNKGLKQCDELKHAQKTLDLAEKMGNADDVAKWGKKVADLQQEVYKSVNAPFMKLLNMIETGKLFVESTGKIVSGVASKIQGDIAMLRAEFDAEIEQLEMLIKMLRKILDKMFQAMEGMGAWMVELGNLQDSIWSSASQTASAVAGANEA